VSLDYIFVKVMSLTSSVDEIEEDKNFRLNDYKSLGSSLFPGIQWDKSNAAILELGDQLLEVEAAEVSLTVRLRGLGADPGLISSLAAQCQKDKILAIDAQTSEIVKPHEKPNGSAEYRAWYQSALKKY
jgi:hypothetical protein